MRRILITGATGQIGSELTPALRRRYGATQVIAAGHKREPPAEIKNSGPYVICDIRDQKALGAIIGDYRIDTIYHLAALLSATAELEPQLAWEVNVNGLRNVLEIARLHDCAVFHPSSIGAFGPGTPRGNTPQVTVQRPETIYGISKVTGELLCDYYHRRYGVDTRGVRFPGLISHVSLPGGGTTDYAVEIFHAAIRDKSYMCYLGPDTRLDMMYMADAVRAAIEVMEADPARLKHRNAYNITAMSITPAELGAAIGKRITPFEIDYEVDPARQAIADSWPDRLDDSAARREWDWSPSYSLAKMVDEMLTRLGEKIPENAPMPPELKEIYDG